MPKAVAQSVARHDRRPPTATRERLLGAASTAIARDGWASATTRRVAALAGVNPGLVHYHFGSMAALRREAALDALAREASTPTRALLEASSLQEGLRACVEALRRLDPTSEAGLVLFEAMLASARDPELRGLLRQELVAFRALLAARLRAEDDAAPEPTAMALAAALDGVLLHRLVDPALDIDLVGSALIGMLHPSTETPPPRGEPR